MNRKLLGAMGTLLVAGSLALIMIGPAWASHEPINCVDTPSLCYTSSPGDGSNEGDFWDDYFNLPDGSCSKLNAADTIAFVMPTAPDGETWYALVVKQGSPQSNEGPDNFIYLDPVAGHAYPSTGKQAPGYSHLILCSVENSTTTTTSQPTTTSTLSSSTTSTVEDSTTTTALNTTTTTVPSTTTSQPEVTTTTVSETTTTGAGSTTTDPGTSSTATPSTLPFTGGNAEGYAKLAFSLLAAGVLFLALTRSRSRVD